jgi:hypothetical protein
MAAGATAVPSYASGSGLVRAPFLWCAYESPIRRRTVPDHFGHQPARIVLDLFSFVFAVVTQSQLSALIDRSFSDHMHWMFGREFREKYPNKRWISFAFPWLLAFWMIAVGLTLTRFLDQMLAHQQPISVFAFSLLFLSSVEALSALFELFTGISVHAGGRAGTLYAANPNPLKTGLSRLGLVSFALVLCFVIFRG